MLWLPQLQQPKGLFSYWGCFNSAVSLIRILPKLLHSQQVWSSFEGTKIIQGNRFFKKRGREIFFILKNHFQSSLQIDFSLLQWSPPAESLCVQCAKSFSNDTDDPLVLTSDKHASYLHSSYISSLTVTAIGQNSLTSISTVPLFRIHSSAEPLISLPHMLHLALETSTSQFLVPRPDFGKWLLAWARSLQLLTIGSKWQEKEEYLEW